MVFDLEALDGTRVSTEASLGRNTVIGFITTYDKASQAEAGFLRMVSRQHVPRVNVYAIALQDPGSRPLVQIFAEWLGLRFPVVLLDPSQAEHAGFPDMKSVPTILILDREGRRVWRKAGIIEAKEIENVLGTLE